MCRLVMGVLLIFVFFYTSSSYALGDHSYGVFVMPYFFGDASSELTSANSLTGGQSLELSGFTKGMRFGVWYRMVHLGYNFSDSKLKIADDTLGRSFALNHQGPFFGLMLWPGYSLQVDAITKTEDELKNVRVGGLQNNATLSGKGYSVALSYWTRLYTMLITLAYTSVQYDEFTHPAVGSAQAADDMSYQAVRLGVTLPLLF